MKVRFLRLSRVRISALFLFIAFFLYQNSIFADANRLDNTHLVQEITLIEAIHHISEQYQVLFNYDRNIVSDIKVQYEPKEFENVDAAIASILKETNLKYQIFSQRYVVIYKNDEEGIESLKEMIQHFQTIVDDREDIVLERQRLRPSPKLIRTLPQDVLRDRALTFSIAGVVTDQDGEPLIGVNIQVKGTNMGTSTDIDGKFAIDDIDENAVLVVSYIGYQTQEVSVAGKSNLSIVLLSDSQLLDEVVVVGYGTQRKKDLTGSIKTIAPSDLPLSSNINITNALRGYTPGLNIQGGSIRAGDNPGISIRGQTSLSASQSPLIVIDGVIFNGSFSDLNMNDIERLDILKDASAAAIYGSRSANGVILITTKKGESKKPTINFNAFYGIQDYTNNPVKWMDAEQYAKRLVDYNYFQFLYNWYAKLPNGPDDQGGKPQHPGYNEASILDVLKSEDERQNYRNGYEIDWLEEVKRVAAPKSNYNLDISGAGDKFHYYASYSNTEQKGIIKNDDFSRTILTGRVGGDILPWLEMGLTTSYSYKDYSGVEASMEHAQNSSPLASKFNAEGYYPTRLNSEFLMAHPLRSEYFDDSDIRKNLLSTGFARLQFARIEGLVINLNYSNNYSTTIRKTYYPSNTYEGETEHGKATNSLSESTFNTYNAIGEYSRDFDKHKISLTGVYTSDKADGSSFLINTQRFSSEILGFNDVGFAEQSAASSGAWDQSAIGYMGRINYGYNSKYLFTATYRKDGFSGFGAKNKFASFYSFAAAWNIGDEDFFRSTSSWLDFLKLRLSYGENGNQGIGRYSSLTSMGVSYYYFGDALAVGLFPSNLGNGNLSWETTTSLNFGIDFSILKNRISGNIDIYNANTKDVLVRRTLPPATGYSNIWTNLGKIHNKGIELELVTINTQGIVNWNSRFVFSLNRDNIVDLYGDKSDDLGNSWFIGEPISAIYDYKRTGDVWQEQDLYSGNIIEGYYPGQYQLEDLNGDNKITSADRTIVGYTVPNYRFSIGTNVSYSNFALSIFVNSIQGGNGYYQGNLKRLLEATSDFDYAQRQNQPAIRENWTPDNNVRNTPAIYNYPKEASGNYQDRSFIRLQNVSLSYRINSDLIERLNINSLDVYLSGNNLFTITNWEGFDPEIGGYYDRMMRDLSLGFRINL